MSLFAKIFIAYEVEHLAEAERQMTNSQSALICLDFNVECECKKRNLPFISWHHLINDEVDEEKWWVLAHDIAREWYRLPSMSFFVYDHIRLAEAPEPIFEAHLARLFYYARALLAIKKSYPNADFYIPAPTKTDELNPVCLASFVSGAVLDAAQLVGLKGNRAERRQSRDCIWPRSSWKLIFLRIYNALINLLPAHNFKIYTSEYWAHFSPITPYLKNTDITVLESRGFTAIPWRQRLAHRMRFLYPDYILSGRDRRLAIHQGVELTKQWSSAKKEVMSYCQGLNKDFDWSPVLEACEYLVGYAPRVIANIITLRRILITEKPNVVLQMASVGGPQHYFFLMAKIAAQLKIPSLELQHATATIDPRSVYCRLETDYLATYGDHINEWHQRLGHSSDHLLTMGSPRFDQYINNYQSGRERGQRLFTQLGLDIKRPVLLVAVPFSEAYVSAVDSYQLNDFFQTVLAAQQRAGDLQILFKCRNARLIPETRHQLEGIFQTNWAISGDEDIFPLLCASDAVVCNNSTVIYQAVLAGKPLILHPWGHFDSYHAQLYNSFIPLIYDADEAASSLAKIFTDESYRQELLKKQKSFLEKYSFDGQSASRVAALLRQLPTLYQRRNR